ncbi:MAG TPA: hypothetical protein VIG74_06920 [Alphaproteobacteria bacterium]
MFKRCDFLLGTESSIVIVVPGHLPKAETYTVSVSDRDIKFRAGYDSFAEIAYPGGDIYQRIANHTQIGIVEHLPGDKLPGSITHVAYVEVRRAG